MVQRLPEHLDCEDLKQIIADFLLSREVTLFKMLSSLSLVHKCFLYFPWV